MNQQQSLGSDLLAQVQGAPMQQMAQQLGANSQQMQSAVETALPLLLGALGNNAAKPQGAADLFGALQRDHGSAMPQGLGGLGGLLGSMLGGGQSPASSAGSNPLGDGAAILGHIFGSNRQTAESGLGQATGLGNNAGQLLAMLAPIVMAFLANRVKAGGMDASSLGQTLEQERQQVQQQGGLGGDLLGSLLDQNGDGKLDVGDLFKLGGSFLSGRR